MKKIKYILLSGLAALALVSCNDLTLQPKGILDDATLLGNTTGVQTYLVSLYMYLPIEDFNYEINNGYYRGGNAWDVSKNYLPTITGEAVGWPGGINNAEGFAATNANNKKYWPYDHIRDINALLEKLPDYKANYNDATYNGLIGEAHFLRAFYYFGMAKRYGGVPIIDRVMDPTAPADTLNVPRATEYDTWKFIHDDLQFAMDNMPATSDPGRANKYVAAALMSRAMLYAGTIAKYGSYTTSTPNEPAAIAGNVGIPIAQAQYFFTEAYNACTFIDGGNYQLVGENAADKEQNYVDMFLQDNQEDIFVKHYSSSAPGNMELYHSYDGATSPSPDFSNWPGSEWVPTLETVELFQKMPIENADGTPVRFNTREELWQQGGLEPRLLANVFFPGMELRGSTFSILRGIYRTYTGTMADAQLGASNAPINVQSNRAVGGGKNQTFGDKTGTGIDQWIPSNTVISGTHGVWGGPENNTVTGLYVRKYVDYNLTPIMAAANSCYHPWKVFRYAEILLNKAEAAYELGKKDEATALIARIRNRAGATVWTPDAAPATVYVINNQIVDENLEFIREERERELLFENHRWWDIRRWRIADQARLDGSTLTLSLRQFKPTGLMPYFVNDENKYVFIREYNTDGKTYNFVPQWYYESIPQVELNNNPNLVQNPIY